MTYVCENCGHSDNPIWKPMYWRHYTSYCDYADFKDQYPELAEQLPKKKTRCEDQYFFYRRGGKTRDIVHRTIKLFAHMSKQALYEKTASEKGHPDPFQGKLDIK